MGEQSGFFEDALSNFMFDVASGGAIRHLTDKGYSVEQIMKELDFPTSRERVEKTAYRYMKDSGILLDRLPVEENELTRHILRMSDAGQIASCLSERICMNGEAHSYMMCPFGRLLKNDKEKLNDMINCLTGREKEYILGIRWERNIMYHRLNGRMREIGIQLAANQDKKENRIWEFYFLKEKEMIQIQPLQEQDMDTRCRNKR